MIADRTVMALGLDFYECDIDILGSIICELHLNK